MVTFTKKDNNLRRQMTVIALILNIVLPLITYFALQMWTLAISGDIMKVDLDRFVVSTQNVLDIIITFGAYALIVNSIVRYGFKNSKKILLITLCGIIVHAFSLFFASFLSLNSLTSYVFQQGFFYSLSIVITELLKLVGVTLLVCYLRGTYIADKTSDITVKKFVEFKNPLSVIAIWATLLIVLCYLPSIILDNKDATGFAIVMPYLRLVFKFVVGYAVMFCVNKWLCFVELTTKTDEQ